MQKLGGEKNWSFSAFLVWFSHTHKAICKIASAEYSKLSSFMFTYKVEYEAADDLQMLVTNKFSSILLVES